MRTSKLGQLYDKEQNIRPDLDEVVKTVMHDFEIYITFGEKLPIYSGALRDSYKQDEIEYILQKFSTQGCTVEYVVEKSPNGKRRFVLTELS